MKNIKKYKIFENSQNDLEDKIHSLASLSFGERGYIY
jgi:hypothetical protein